ncbi:MAG: hypothetical protein HXY34_10045 [Candidatus Thorarchaeota archaeon]|nr:hypothetical protein [Candidatus Thorarchaeota archaeon]
MTLTHRTKQDTLIERLFLSVNVASIVAILTWGVFYAGYLLTNEAILQSILDALANWDFLAFQAAIESVTSGIISSDGWVSVAIGLGLLFMSILFVLNTGGIVFSVFIHRSFSAGGTPTLRWWRLSISRLYLTVRLVFFIALYKASSATGFDILLKRFPDNTVLNLSFFFSSALSLGTIIVLASVIKVVVYELARYETMIESNRTRISRALKEYLDRWRNQMILIEEALFSDDVGYVRAKLEDATRDMKSDVRLLERSRSDLDRIASPQEIIRKLLLTFIGVVIIQMAADIVLYVGWGRVLDLIMGWIL